MNDFKVSFNKYPSKAPPNSKEIEMLNSFTADNAVAINRDSIQSFADMVGNKGCSFCPATFNGGVKSKETFDQSQLLALYFDSMDISLAEVTNRAERYGLPIVFAYDTFSTGNRRRFTVVFLNDAPVPHLKVAEIISEALLTIFPEADPKSRDITSLFHGGNKLLFFDEAVPTINVYSLIMNMCLCLKKRYGDNHKRNVYDFSERTGLGLTDRKMPDVSVVESLSKADLLEVTGFTDEDLSPIPNIYIIENGDKSSSGTTGTKLFYIINGNQRIRGNSTDTADQPHPDKKNRRTHLTHRSADLTVFGSDCRLLRDFEAGTLKLNLDELLDFSTTFIQIESGSSWLMGILRKHSYFGGDPAKYENWEYYLSYMKKTDRQASPCDRFCPYSRQCHHAGNISSTAKPKQRTAKKLANIDAGKYYGVDEAAEDCRLKFLEARDANGADIHIINASTGVGKSTIVLNDMAKNPHKKYIFACSTNKLKDEKYEEALALGIKAVCSPSLLDLKDKLPPKVWERIEYFFQIGKPRAVISYIDELIAKREIDKPSYDILKKYKDDMAAFYSGNCHAFTTHSRLFTMDYWYLRGFDAVIFDEDPILSCMIPNQVEIPVSMLTKALEGIDPNCPLAKKITAAVSAAKRKELFTLSRIDYTRAYDAISTPIDIASFCLADRFYHKKKSDDNNLWESNLPEDSFVFFKPFKLHRGIKYIILSATANKEICGYCFGLTHRVIFHACKQAELKGSLNQYPEFPMSRAFIDKSPGILNDLIEFFSPDDVITFKKYGMGKYYLCNTTGINALKGKDLLVPGTPHQPPWLYKLFAYTNGFHFDENAAMRNQPVKYNGYSSWFMTFDKDNEFLRKIQFWMIESNLLQAIGRARLTRETCTVDVVSNYLLPQATQQQLPIHILDKYKAAKAEDLSSHS